MKISLKSISPKLKIIVLVVILGLLFIVGVVGFVLLSKEYKKTQVLEQKIEELSGDRERTEQDLSLAKQEVAKLNRTLKESNTKIQFLSSQVDDGEKAKKDLQIQLDASSSQVKEEKKTKQQLEKRVSRLQGDLENFLARFKELEEEKVNLQVQLDRYEAQVELGTIVVDSEEEFNSTTGRKAKNDSLSGNIIKVNREYGFLVIDIGRSQGVKEGDVFSVYHKGKSIGDVKVESVHSTLSAANFLPNLKTKLVRESDSVAKKD